MTEGTLVVPPSHAQQRLWFLEQLQPGESAYNLSVVVRLTGPLRVGALEQSLTEIVRRHEVLRTTFAAVDGRPVQRVIPAPSIKPRVVDLEKLPAPERDAQAQRLTVEEAERCFDLAQGPLLRALLVQLEEQEHLLQLTTHYIVADGWSIGVLFRELGALYSAFSRGRPSPLPELQIQYRDVAIWQREWLQGDRLDSQLAYWSERLAGAPPVLRLPTDHPRPSVQTHRGAQRPLVMPRHLTEALKALSRQEGVTLFMTLLAAFQTLLHRYSGNEEIVVGTPIANRRRAELEELIGPFANPLPLRTDLAGDPTFRELLARVREVALGAYEHQDLPFEKLVEELQPQRDLGHTPLFQVMIVLRDAPMPPPEMAGLFTSLLEVDNGTAKFELNLVLTDTEQGLQGVLEYSTDLFAASTITRMLGHLESLLTAIVADPEQHLSQLPLLTGTEREQLLGEWNHTGAEYPRERCIHELFEAQVERTPDALALVYGVERLSYRELNRRANQLAHHLRSLGVGPEALVGVCMERSAELVVALLAILKAGGAYVPLDPAYPRDRLAFMLRDTDAAVLLTQEPVWEELARQGTIGKSGMEVFCLDADAEVVSRQRGVNPQSGVTSQNLAYVIYTSGSTGQPKGVAIEHHSTVALLSWARGVYSSEQLHGVLASTSVCFDLSVFELFVPLSWGGTVILVDHVLQLPHVTGPDVTLINTVPSAIAELLRLHPLPASIRVVNLAGEPLSTALVQQIYQQAAVEQVFDLYGPSEDTTYSTFAPRSGTRRATIGRPIANTQVYVLDTNKQPVPVGVPGELYIGGEGLARGYLNRPELTAERFVPHPLSQQPGARLYRTGDLCRWREDGNLEFLGRLDHQVKVRGFRIELGEIEAVLGRHPGVQECLVLAREDIPGEKRLVAYVVPAAGQPVQPAELRHLLKTKLPEYMIPAAFVELARLPLTPNGKVDRRALPSPDPARPALETAYVDPRTPIEEGLAEIWAALLRLERVGAHDNFFELGGHSLLATQVISRVRELFQVDLPLPCLFEAPTVQGLARLIETDARAEQPALPPPVRAVAREGPLPLSFAQQRLWFLDQLQPGERAYHLPAVIRLRGPLHGAALEQSLTELARRHEALRTSFSAVDGRPVQVIGPAAKVALPVVDLRPLPTADREAEAQRRAEAEARQPFDLARGPLWRATLLHLHADEHVLLLTLHHIVTDGWSMEVLYRELGLLYAAFAAGQPSPLPELPIQYADFAVWQRQLLQGEALERQLAYWRRQLAGAPAVLDLPLDRPRPPLQTYRGALDTLDLSPALTQALKTLCQRERVTLFMALLAAFQTLLSRYSGHEDLAVGTPIANRNRAETEALIGFFVNTLVLRTDLAGDPPFRALLGRVREVALGAYAHQDLPFEKLVEELQPPRDLSHPPLFQVMFNWHTFAADPLHLAGLTVQVSSPLEHGSKVDLTLYAGESAGTIRLTLVYNPDLFDAATIAQMLQHLRTLLAGIVADPDQRLSRLPLALDAGPPRPAARPHPALLARPFIEFPRPDLEQSIPARFERQVRRYGSRTAIKTTTHEWTYQHLNRLANHVAQLIRTRCGAGDGRLALLFQHDAPMIAAIFGALKAGKCYVPLDPTSPRERLEYMLQDSGATTLLTDRRNRAAAAALAHGDRQILSVEDLQPSASMDGSPGEAVRPETVAYILYTSGSTGRPKGVVQNHRNVLHFIRAYTNNLHISADDRLTLLSSYSFDAAVMDIFGALLNGAALHPIDLKEDGLSRLIAQLVEARITLYHSTPTVYRYLMTALAGQEDLSRVRLVVLGGEAVHRSDVDLYKRSFSPRCLFVNGLGPTEATVALQGVLDHRTELTSEAVPVGYPVEETDILLLNAAGRPTAGRSGEIAIRSPYVALGYWNRPDLTQAAFLPDPDGGTRRIYRTGDWGKRLPDGQIQCLGRRDAQVKIRGYRIEPGEVEARLREQPAIREAAVVAHADRPGEPRLVAYLVPDPEQPPPIPEVRRALTATLPEYMIPSAFVLLDRLPLTPTGKIDRQALPAPEPKPPELEQAPVAPSTPVEKALAAIWAEVLGLEKVGIDDNFFELGGHSLLATQVVARLRNALNVEVPLRRLFEAPTVVSLALTVTTSMATAAGSEMAQELAQLDDRLDDEADSSFRTR